MDITRTTFKKLECLKINDHAGTTRQEALHLIDNILRENESSMLNLELDCPMKANCGITANLHRLEYLTLADAFSIENKITCPRLKELTIICRPSKVKQQHCMFLQSLLTHNKFENIKKLRITAKIAPTVDVSESNLRVLWKLPQLEVIEIDKPFVNYIRILMKFLQAPNISKAKLSYFSKDDLKIFFDLCTKIKCLTIIENAINRMEFLQVTSKVLFGQQRLGNHYSLDYANIEAALEHCKCLESLTIRYTRHMTSTYEVIDLFSYLTRFKRPILCESFKTLNVFTEAKAELFSDDKVFKNISEGHEIHIEIFDGINSKKIRILKKTFNIHLFFDSII